MKMYTGENRPESEGKPEHKFDAAIGTIFRISVFEEASRNFNAYFSRV
jgi:hypothetical protein